MIHFIQRVTSLLIFDLSQQFMEQPLQVQVHIVSIILVALTYIPGE